MRAELYASAAVHVGLLAWLLFGDSLFQARVEDDFEVTGVSIIANAEFEALMNPVLVAPSVAPDAPTPPVPQPEPDPAELPEPEEAALPIQQQPEITEAPAPDPEPEPVPPTPQAEVSDEVTALLPPELGAPDAPQSDTPTPEQAPRVAPTPAPAPPPDVETAPDVQAAPSEEAPTETPEVVEEEAAPEEATTEIVTEADEPFSAPVASLRPMTRPNRPAPQPASDTLADAIANAVSDANQAQPAPAPAPAIPAGPPLSFSQISGFELAISRCFELGALGTGALESVVLVGFELNQDGSVVIESVRLLDVLEGSESVANRLFEAARRAIIRCGRNGYDLPVESYGRWQNIEAVFRPDGMTLR